MSHSGLTAKSAESPSTYQGKYPTVTILGSDDRCKKKKMGYVSACHKPVKAYFMSVYDPAVIFQVCGIHRRIFEKYVSRGSFIEIETA